VITVSKATAYARALTSEFGRGPVDLFRFAPRLGLEVHEINADGFDGALIRVRELSLGSVVIRKSIREAGRKNFTLAHEVGHFLLPGHDQTEPVCTNSDVGNWGDGSKQAEREADEFAAELLMPAALVERIARSAEPSLQLIERIAHRCRTSLSAAAWRYCDLTKEPCAIAWSREGRIDWSKRSEFFTFPLRTGAVIEQGTFALRAFTGKTVPKEPVEVPLQAWISSAVLPDDTKLFEQSKALPTYASVLSLLWLRR
jgi:hypothetical protein